MQLQGCGLRTWIKCPGEKRAVKMAAQSPAVHVILNNNADDYAPRNAADLRKVLERDFPQVATGPAPTVKATDLPGLEH